jgi:TRAP-type C4-dicarboxylate transport system permease small subunit
MHAFCRLIRAISHLCGIVAAAFVGSAILVVCQMVVMRYFLNASTIWQPEYVIFALVAATFIGSPYVLLVKGHVNVDLLPNFLGPVGRRILAVVASFAGLLFCAVLAWKGYELFEEALVNDWTTDTIWALPLWIPYMAMPIGIGLLALQYVADIFALLVGEPMPFAMDHHSGFEGE